MDTQKRVLTGVVLLLALLILFFLIRSMYTEKIALGYIYEPAGFSFVHHPQFKVEEKIEEGAYRTVTLVPVVSIPVATTTVSEAEPEIQCLIVKNTENQTLSSWIKSKNHASLAGLLIDGTVYPSVDVPGVEALGFKTDGLYASDHVAFGHKGHFIDCSVEYITLDDPLRMNFATFISNIKLSSK